MGSSKVIATHTIKMEEKKSFKKIFEKTVQVLFQKGKHKKEKSKDTKDTKENKDVTVRTAPRNEIKVTPVTVLMQNFEKLEIQRREEKLKEEDDDDDERKNFSYSVIKETSKDAVIGSQLSSESEFDETLSTHSDDNDEDRKEQSKEDKLVDSLQKLKVEDKKKSSKDRSIVESQPITNVSANEDERSLVESLKNLKVADKETKKITDDKKKKLVSTVLIRRGPDKKKVSNYIPSTHPYIETSNNYRHINQINPQTLSGGQVIVNESATLDTCPELSVALTQLDRNINVFQQNTEQEQAAHFEAALDFIFEKSAPNSISNIPNTNVFQDPFLVNQLNIYPTPPRSENIPSPSSDSHAYSFHSESNTFPNIPSPSLHYNTFANCVDSCNIISNMSSPLQHHIPSPATSSPMSNGDYEKFQDIIHGSPSFLTSYENISTSLSPPTSSPIYNADNGAYKSSHNYLTHFNYKKSPVEKSTNISTSLSPSTSSMYNSDNEKYQDITSDYLPSLSSPTEEKKKQEKTRSNSTSKTMKQYKDLQKEIAHAFSKKLCCQTNRKSTKEIFQGYMEKLKMEERKYLCFKVAYLKLEEAYDVLYHILANLTTNEDPFQLALLSLICEKVLALKPGMFIDNYGLSLLSLAVLRCFKLPVLTRYLVQCIRTVTRNEAYKPTKEYVFNMVTDQGDTLVLQCARAGDDCADTLAELLRVEGGDKPLFDVHHANINGQSALHVVCAQGGPHVLHVLLKHGAADLWRGDVKGGDTPLHLAVNSATCDLRIVMVLFQHIDNKDRKRLAHAPNRSLNTPLEYARSAFKSRQNYPAEVLEFLKKCR